MLARCSRCQNTFFTETSGLQKCPHCGTDVMIQAPGPAAPQAAPAPPPVDLRTPWECRGELGTWPALLATVQQGLVEPKKLYDTMRADTLEGAHLLFGLLLVVPAMLGAIFERLLSDPSEGLGRAAALYETMGQPQAAEQLRTLVSSLEWLSSWRMFVVELALTPVGLFLGLYAIAGGTHLLLLAFGKASGGFSGTLKACIYALAPGFLVVIPGCGWLIALTWATVLQIYGLSRLHRIGAEWATAGVIGLHAILLCCLCGIPAVLLAATLGTWMGQVS